MKSFMKNLHLKGLGKYIYLRLELGCVLTHLQMTFENMGIGEMFHNDTPFSIMFLSLQELYFIHREFVHDCV